MTLNLPSILEVPSAGACCFIAITPDDTTAYVGGSITVTPISTATDLPGKPAQLRYGLPAGIVITP